MTGTNRKVLRVHVVLWLTIVSLMTSASQASAYAECEAVNAFDQPRECTITEEFGSCLFDSRESWRQCMEEAGDVWWKVLLCDGGSLVDILACAAGLPFDVLQV